MGGEERPGDDLVAIYQIVFVDFRRSGHFRVNRKGHENILEYLFKFVESRTNGTFSKVKQEEGVEIHSSAFDHGAYGLNR